MKRWFAFFRITALIGTTKLIDVTFLVGLSRAFWIVILTDVRHNAVLLNLSIRADVSFIVVWFGQNLHICQLYRQVYTLGNY